ncbi:MAG TPA: saccharopine dehydrogenase NADP-binding domain-containing protein, partial [Rhizobiaceae bacterium]|nr:saccharopine dehydrogenase NADP-binding domain-containing protein [Rhizobiaceae bacterium]
MAPTYPIHAKITGPIVMIGFGSIGRGTLPLIERHFEYDESRFVVIDPHPEGENAEILKRHGVRFIQSAVTRDNYEELLTPLLTQGEGQGFCVNLSVDTSSLDLMRLCRKLGVLYIDTVVEPWLGFYFDKTASNASRTNYALRETVRAEKAANPGGATAVSCCGANPGMVSWFVKQALVDLAAELAPGVAEPGPDDRAGWARLMQQVGVKGIHIAERDTQRTRNPKPLNVFWNTWSVEGFISEGLQPAELGWGTHEKWRPDNARGHEAGCKAAIFLEQPGANTRVRTWCPTPGAQYGFLVTHNEAISIADYFTVRNADGAAAYRPTCHYAYHPCNDAVLSLHEMFGNGGNAQAKLHVLDEDELIDGADELGVFVYGHDRNAYWYGSRLTLDEARHLVPYQNATG